VPKTALRKKDIEHARPKENDTNTYCNGN